MAHLYLEHSTLSNAGVIVDVWDALGKGRTTAFAEEKGYSSRRAYSTA